MSIFIVMFILYGDSDIERKDVASNSVQMMKCVDKESPVELNWHKLLINMLNMIVGMLFWL